VKRAALLFASWLALACASAPRPQVMNDVASVSRGAQAQEAARLAPQAHAKAELLKRQAEDAYGSGDMAGAQILSETALAAYSHAFVLARLARASSELEKAKAELAKAKTALVDIDEKQKRAGAEADAIELRVKVARDAMPLSPNAPASPEREKARLDAARSLTSQARLLCAATRLLDPSSSGLDAELGKISDLEKALGASPRNTPIDEAIALRSSCLKRLTVVRRPKTRATVAANVADALLADLGKSGELVPFRDDRGVVVTLRGLFAADGKLKPEAVKLLETLGAVAKAHADFPVLVVVHSSAGRGGDAEKKRGQTVADALGRAGATKVDVQAVGSSQPVMDPARSGSDRRNDRVEIVFVAPAG
jgi:flagellar motor protein MotB